MKLEFNLVDKFTEYTKKIWIISKNLFLVFAICTFNTKSNCMSVLKNIIRADNKLKLFEWSISKIIENKISKNLPEKLMDDLEFIHDFLNVV